MSSRSFDQLAERLFSLGARPEAGDVAGFAPEAIEDVLALYLLSREGAQRPATPRAIEVLTRFTRRAGLATASDEDDYGQRVEAHFKAHPPQLALIKAMTLIARELHLEGGPVAQGGDHAALLAREQDQTPLQGKVSDGASLYQLRLGKKPGDQR